MPISYCSNYLYDEHYIMFYDALLYTVTMAWFYQIRWREHGAFVCTNWTKVKILFVIDVSVIISNSYFSQFPNQNLFFLIRSTL